MLTGTVAKRLKSIAAAVLVKSAFVNPGLPPPDDLRAASPQSRPFQKEAYYEDQGSLWGKLANAMLAP